MKNTPFKFLFLLIINLTFVFSAAAWDDTGHKLTTYIAWEQMSPQAREKAFKILMSAPEDAHLSVFYLQDSRSAAVKQRELFMLASTWADIVRDKDFKNRYAKYHKGDWHYADTYWRVTDGKVEVLKDFAEPTGKAVEQLFAFEKLLRNTNADDADKAIALAWILHLGGDIHQPLHTSGRVTEYDLKGDQGGNRYSLSPKEATGDARLNLHWFWDSIIGRNIARRDDACDAEYLRGIVQVTKRKYPYTEMQSRLKLGKFDDWQQEGFQIASTKLYPESLKFGVEPTEEYRKMAFEISQERLALAGYRMGEMLNQILFTMEDFNADKAKYEKEAKDSGSKIGQGADDVWLWLNTREKLYKAVDLRDSSIYVDVDNSVITLRGTVLNEQHKALAVQVAKNVEGVSDVKNLLKISR